MTPMMSLFLRCLLAFVLVIVLLALTDYAMAATPVEAMHSALDAMGPQAQHWVDLWRIVLGTTTVFFVTILIALALALSRAPRADESVPPELSTVNRLEPAPRRHVARAVIVSVIALVALVVASFFTDRALARLPLSHAVHIELTGYQWWWGARYLDGSDAHDIFSTANELHIPVGRPVVIELKGGDVIHSLWLPNLAGKKDLIPGRTALLELRADRPGVYRAQCAEFCGLEHALMTLYIYADAPDEFDAWVRTQRQSAPEPTDAKAQRGLQVFQSSSCAMCHGITGADFAGAQHAPDLTHVAGRQTIAAGTLKNTPENLASWIRDPQIHKPGAAMPATPLSQEDLDAVVAYLEGLK
jgi:cytochrome c oxidase subunit II